MDATSIRIILAVTIAFIYMLFDIFNKRNVPEAYAYATLAIGAIAALFSGSIMLDAQTYLIAVAILGIGYAIYRSGQIGAADIIEFAAIAMVIPIQQAAILLPSINQYGLPFAISLLINTGIIAIIMVPIYYLPKAFIKHRKSFERIKRLDLYKLIIISAAYMGFASFLALKFNITLYGAAILLLLGVSSAVVMLFEGPITSAMVVMSSYHEFTEGDIIAFNLMSQEEIKQAKKIVPKFDRLVTKEIIAQMKEKNLEKKFPLYRNAIPLALPIFVAVVCAIIAGNLMLVII